MSNSNCARITCDWDFFLRSYCERRWPAQSFVPLPRPFALATKKNFWWQVSATYPFRQFKTKELVKTRGTQRAKSTKSCKKAFFKYLMVFEACLKRCFH